MAAVVSNPGLSTSSITYRKEGRSVGLLTAGVVAGPFYVALSLVQALTRHGFDLRRHDISLLANGSLGWIQIANFLISGALVVAAAVGMRGALRAGRGRTWGPLLVGVYGACIALAGVFVADPANGFPIGTAADVQTVSLHGLLHLLCAAVGFLALIAACFVFARRFSTEGQRRWAWYSRGTGGAFCVAFFGSVFLTSSPATFGWSVLGLWVAVLLGWSWLAAVSARGVQS